MRISPAAAAVPLLIVLLTWLSLRAINSNAEVFDRALDELDRFATVEAALHRDVLSARIGLLRNYDPLVKETNELDAVLDRLHATAAIDKRSAATVDRLMASVNQQEQLIEEFKSKNALLQNSLAYFGLFSGRLDKRDLNGPLTPAVTALATAMLRLTLDTSPATAQEVQDRLNELAMQPLPLDAADSVPALLAHGRLLHDLLPATDDLLKSLCSVPRKLDQSELRTMILAHQAASRATARKFRLVLYVTSLMLVVILVYLGLQLRARARALQRRAAFEHVIAGVSMRFINTQPRDMNARIQQALAELAECIDADRAYFLLTGASAETYTWCRRGVEFPPGWPEQAPSLVVRLTPPGEDVLHIPRLHRMAGGRDRDILANLGLQGWACTFRNVTHGGTALLGFDAVRQPCRVSRGGELVLFRMAFDAIANAISREALEQERSRLETRLQQARRLETVGALASGIAHNFNNIVGAILGYTEMAAELDSSDSRSARIFDEIHRAGERARELVDQILTFARRRDAHRKAVNVHALIAETVSLLRASLPRTVELSIRETSDSAIVSGAQAQLQQVILNLCNNAAQAMGEVGRIEIATETVVIGLPMTRSLSHGDLAPGRYVCIAVSDGGRGMDASVLARIFEPFFTTRMSGNGLGLATSHDIVREHGGAINVQSIIGVGSRFEVWLPRIAAPAVTVDADADIATLPLGHGETVLVVENDSERLLRNEEILAALGFEPVGFTRAGDALAACRASAERFDVVVVGHLASALAALELAATLHEVVPDVPILLATTSVDDIAANALLAAGISDVVPWPIIATEISTALADCLALQKFRKGAPIGVGREAYS